MGSDCSELLKCHLQDDLSVPCCLEPLGHISRNIFLMVQRYRSFCTSWHDKLVGKEEPWCGLLFTQANVVTAMVFLFVVGLKTIQYSTIDIYCLIYWVKAASVKCIRFVGADI